MGALMIALVIAAMLQSPDPSSMRWFTEEPWKDCPDCDGTGEIDISYPHLGEDPDIIDCPCTQVLR